MIKGRTLSEILAEIDEKQSKAHIAGCFWCLNIDKTKRPFFFRKEVRTVKRRLACPKHLKAARRWALNV